MEDKEHQEGCGCGHDHVHETDCGCGCDHGHQTVTITFDNDTEVECAVLGIFDADGKEYIALVPVGDEEVLIYRYHEVDGQADLSQIESDEEYEMVAEAFYVAFNDELELDEDEEPEA